MTKSTLVRSAIKKGAVFEIDYAGALGGENDSILVESDAAGNGLRKDKPKKHHKTLW